MQNITLSFLKFVAELFKLSVVPNRILHEIIHRLTNFEDCDAIDELGNLFLTVGKHQDVGISKVRVGLWVILSV